MINKIPILTIPSYKKIRDEKVNKEGTDGSAGGMCKGI